ncbi:response regulator [Aestuariibius sp. HNIBRBA575]|uniref:response regulator n=1 Tax=Aestuariibius sp. HNIBRBA575 TaxID=3233343 RepID=UPI0034A3590F
MDNLDDFLMTRPPTANRPLLGHTVLAVEDSRFASEALRLLSLRSGARIRRADSLHHARRHLRVYRPSVIIIDLGLPDGAGEDLIQELANTSPRVEVILGISGDVDAAERALNAGADGFIAKPIASLAAFQQAILDHLPADKQPPMPRNVSAEIIHPDRLAYRDDLAHVAEMLGDGQTGEQDLPQKLDYVTQFLSGLALSADDADLSAALIDLDHGTYSREQLSTEAMRLSKLVQDRIAAQSQI